MLRLLEHINVLLLLLVIAGRRKRVLSPILIRKVSMSDPIPHRDVIGEDSLVRIFKIDLLGLAKSKLLICLLTIRGTVRHGASRIE